MSTGLASTTTRGAELERRGEAHHAAIVGETSILLDVVAAQLVHAQQLVVEPELGPAL